MNVLSDSWNHFRCRIFLFFPIFLDIDECQKNTHDCHLNATCQNTNGSFVCTCLFGFNGDGRSCTGNCLAMTLRNVSLLSSDNSFITMIANVMLFHRIKVKNECVIRLVEPLPL